MPRADSGVEPVGEEPEAQIPGRESPPSLQIERLAQRFTVSSSSCSTPLGT